MRVAIVEVECVIFANDPTVLGGALTPYVAKKWMRALEIARDNRIPYVSFVESAGADLRMDPDSGSKKKRRPAKVNHFAESGRWEIGIHATTGTIRTKVRGATIEHHERWSGLLVRSWRRLDDPERQAWAASDSPRRRAIDEYQEL